MAFINWNDSYSVNVEEIDNQHKELVGMINDFYEKINKEDGRVLVENLIVRMREYVIMHFEFEKRMMRKYDFPELTDHHAEHNLFIEKVKSLEYKILNNTFVLSFEITNFLREWLNKHILESDMQYAHYFESKKIEVFV